MIQIVAKGGTILVDDEDFDLLSEYKWRCYLNNGHLYATAYRFGKTVIMHRLILGITDSRIVVDHIDGNGMNNQRKNLRPCSQGENAKNRGTDARSKSGYKGVMWCKKRLKWKAYITVNYKNIHLGFHSTKERAAVAYNNAVVKMHGEFARLNEIKQHE